MSWSCSSNLVSRSCMVRLDCVNDEAVGAVLLEDGAVVTAATEWNGLFG